MVYPTSPAEWHKWIEDHLGFTIDEAWELYNSTTFPIGVLIENWKIEFTLANGYTPDFIPALIRNVEAFLKWIYNDGSEPLWKGSDEAH